MRPLLPLTLIFTAALCFIAGYTVGKKHGTGSAPAAPIQTTTVQLPEPVEKQVPLPEETAAPAPAPVVVELTATERFKARAQQNIITLKDTKDRSLSGQLIEATQQSLKMRRQSDNRVVDVPVAMLCADDQDFAAYLFKSAKGSQQSASISDADKIWDELFKGM